MNIGEKLRKIRETKGYSQEGVARDAGIEHQYLSRLELGKSSPTFKILEQIITKGLGISLSEFFENSAPKNFPAAERREIDERLAGRLLRKITKDDSIDEKDESTKKGEHQEWK